MTDEHEHNWQYQGRYGQVNPRQIAGTGSKDVDVFDVYFCSRCLERKKIPTNLRGYQTYGAQPWEGEWIA